MKINVHKKQVLPYNIFETLKKFINNPETSITSSTQNKKIDKKYAIEEKEEDKS